MSKVAAEGLVVDLDTKILAEWATLNSRVRMQILKDFVAGLPVELSVKLPSVHLESFSEQIEDTRRR